MPDKVVDASVIAALAFEEPRAGEARDLMRNANLFAPDILPYELASVALKKARNLPSRLSDIAMRLQSALSLRVELVAITPVEMVSLGFETGLSVYDAAYLQTAQRLGFPLLTFDPKLARHARSIRRA